MVDARSSTAASSSLHGGRHRDEALPVFLERQSDALLFALGVEGFDKCAIIGDAHEIVLRADLGQPTDDRLEIDRRPAVVSSNPASRQVR